MFSYLFENKQANFSLNLVQIIFDWRGVQVCSNERPYSLHKGESHERAKRGLGLQEPLGWKSGNLQKNFPL
jgi:hypothetical protein